MLTIKFYLINAKDAV